MSAPTAPPEAVDLVGPALPTLEEYAALLAGPGLLRGLLGPDEVPRLWPRHLLNCAGLIPSVDEVVHDQNRPCVIDLGSGAGLPGVVLAAMRPSWQVVLLEPQSRRTTFLTEVVSALRLTNASVLRARAQDADLHGDVVVARAVAPLHRLVHWALPLVRSGGALLALKGERAQEEVDRDAPSVRRAGGVVVDVRPVPGGPGRVVRVERADPSGAAPGPSAPRGRSTSPPERGTMATMATTTGPALHRTADPVRQHQSRQDAQEGRR